MRWAIYLIVLCLAAAPTFAGMERYTFNATAGSMVFNVQGQGSTSSAVGGTFAVTIFDRSAHFGASDTFMLEDANLYNTAVLRLGLAGVVTASITPHSARFLDFAPVGWGHVTGNNVAATVNTDVYSEATIMSTGLYNFAFATKVWAKTLLPYQMSFSTSVYRSGVINASILGTYEIITGISEIGLTMTLDLILNVQGTAHAIPDPSLGGLTALGLGGAGLWLRRRRG